MGIFYDDELYHHGILGMKWGIRRYQPYQKGYSGKGKFVGKESSGEGKTRSRLKTAAKVAAGAALAGGAGYLAYKNRGAIAKAAKDVGTNAKGFVRGLQNKRVPGPTTFVNRLPKPNDNVVGDAKGIMSMGRYQTIPGVGVVPTGLRNYKKAPVNPITTGEKLGRVVSTTLKRGKNLVKSGVKTAQKNAGKTAQKLMDEGSKLSKNVGTSAVNIGKSAADTAKKVASNRRVQTAAVGSLAAGAAGVPVMYAANKAQKALDRKMAPYTAAMLSAKNPNAEVSYTQYRKKKRNQ